MPFLPQDVCTIFPKNFFPCDFSLNFFLAQNKAWGQDNIPKLFEMLRGNQEIQRKEQILSALNGLAKEGKKQVF